MMKKTRTQYIRSDRKTKKLFNKHQLSTDWKIVEKVEPSQLINSLAMICPFTISEKQRLLETMNIKERNDVLNQIINFLYT